MGLLPLVVQLLRFRASNTKAVDWIPNWRTKIHVPCDVAKKIKIIYSNNNLKL